MDSLPYKIACLCDLRDAHGRVLLLRRAKAPNLGLCSPIGGKLDMHTGESPAQCAQREILEEAGLHVPISRLHLTGLISEAAYEGRSHWLIFLYRVLGPVWVEPHDMREGRLDWFRLDQIDSLPLPDTDRNIIWPLIRSHEPPSSGIPSRLASQPTSGSQQEDPTVSPRPSFFAVHIDCTSAPMRWSVEQRDPQADVVDAGSAQFSS